MQKLLSKIKKIITKRYLVYHLRWQISAFVMMPFMIVLQASLPLWANLMVGQFIGAIIFYGIDSHILKEHKEDSLESIMDDVILNPEVSERKI